MIKHVYLLFILFFSGCILTTEAQSSDPEYTLFLIGDCGEPLIMDSPIGKVFQREVSKTGAQTTVLYLGDNVYPSGIPAVGKPGRERAEAILQTQADWLKGTQAKGVFIPGNHDWQHWGKQGWNYVLNQQQWVDSLHDKNITLLPRDACPGPVEIALTDDVVLIIIDTQWLLHGYDKPGEESDCSAKNPSEFFTLLEDALIRNSTKRIILAGHHPMITYGDHGGVFTWKDHLFPLLDLNHNLYIPMPVIGSLYPLYRGVFGHPQDVTHPVYREYSKLIQKMLSSYTGSFYIAGHEHALQHIVKDSVHYVVSGSGSKTTTVKKKKYARYVNGVTGFAKLTLTKNGAAILQFWQVDDDHPDGKIIHEDSISSIKRIAQSQIKIHDYQGQYVKVAASQQYNGNATRDFFLGENYRNTWSTEIEVPVFDLGQEKGGLQIVQKGGGQQTLSLRLQDSTGKEYTLRSVEKFPIKAVPEMLRGTFAQDIVQDQISAAHPYAAVVIPGLAEAAGIYHTNPKVVYIPDDPWLGFYQKDFANTLALFEERPDDDWEESAFFGNSNNIINTSKVLEKLKKDSDNKVDQPFVLKSRLFDLWIGDWDRHDDQWRWASYKNNKEELFRPIPRDRDQAFFVNEGILPKFWSRKWALPKFEGFDEEIDWAPGFSFNARYFDRSFLNEVSKDEWLQAAELLKSKLTDDVIEKAIQQWPAEIYNKDGEEIIKRLKARRSHLTEDALAHYQFLAREVTITGSDKNEKFVIHRLANGDVDVKVYKITKDGNDKDIYNRLFNIEETNEIRLYGLGGEDVFEVKGESKKSIRVRIIGGEDKDSLIDHSFVQGLSKKTLFYDDKEVNNIQSKGETRNLTSSDPQVNVYDRKEFKYNRLAPLLYGNFNPDDGLFFGGGFLYQTEGFRKSPFKQRHILLASIAPRTSSYNLLYRGDFTEVFGEWGLAINADLKSPNYVNNFFGLGNETEYDKDIDDKPGYEVDDAIDYYRFRFEEIKLELNLTRKIGESGMISFGPALQGIEIEKYDEERFIDAYAETLAYDLFSEHNMYGGLNLSFLLDKRNDPTFTTRGGQINLSARTMAGLDKRANNFTSVDGAISFYHSFRLPARLVFAGRVGGGRTLGDYNFYQAQVLGGKAELRGYRKTRFYGDSRLFGNFEMRLKLTSFRTYLFPASIGLVGFYDVGRVWYKDETGIDPSADGQSSLWHNGWGGGIWFTPFNLTILSVEAGHSDEGTLGYVRLGFLF